MSRSLFIVLAVLALILSVSAQTSTSSSSSSSSAASRSSSSSSSSVSAPSSSSSLSSLSSLSSSSSLASSSSSTGVTGALVSNVSSSSSSSSSSSGVNVFNASSSSSSSSSYVSSSTASTTPSVPTYPVGSYAVTALGLNFSSGAANATSDNVRLDIASNVAVQNNLTANAVLPYIVITAFNTTGASSASLTTVSFVVLSNISALGVNVASVVQKLQAAGAAGQLVAPFSGASLPAQTVIVVLLGSYSSSSSTGAYTPASTYPTGSIGGSFYVTSNGSLTTAQAVPLVRSDIAYNLATLNNLTNSAQVEPYVVITNFNGAQLAPANRRLLQTATNTTVSFIILGNITNLGNAFADTTSIVQKFQAAVAAGNLSTPNLATVGAGIPAQTIYLYVPGVSSSTGGDNNGNNAASSAASASVALLFAAVASLALLF